MASTPPTMILPPLEETLPPAADAETLTTRQRVMPLVVQGFSLEEIRRKLKIPSVDKALTYLRWALQQRALPQDQIEEMRALHIATCEEVKKRAFAAYERSCQDEVSTTTTITGQDEEKKQIKVVEKRRGQSGDPSYLRVILEVLKRESELLGLDKPKQITVDNNQRVEVLETVVFTRDQADMMQGLIPRMPNAPQIGSESAPTILDVPSTDTAAS